MDNTTPVVKQTATFCRCYASFWAGMLFLVTWIMGIVMAKGFWSTFFAMFIPPWAWYLVTERAMTILLGPAWL